MYKYTWPHIGLTLMSVSHLGDCIISQRCEKSDKIILEHKGTCLHKTSRVDRCLMWPLWCDHWFWHLWWQVRLKSRICLQDAWYAYMPRASFVDFAHVSFRLAHQFDALIRFHNLNTVYLNSNGVGWMFRYWGSFMLSTWDLVKWTNICGKMLWW